MSIQRNCAVLALVFGYLVFSNFAIAATLTWDAGGDGTGWYDGANWNPDTVPSSNTSDNLIVNSGTPTAITNAGLISGGTLTINGGAVTWNGRFHAIGTTTGGPLSTGTLTLLSGSLTRNYTGGASNNFTIGNGANTNGLIDQQGGTVSVLGNGATATDQRLAIGVGDASAKGEYRISGGSLSVSGNLLNGETSGATATFHYIGDDATVAVGGQYLSTFASTKTIFELDGLARTIINVTDNVSLNNSTVQISAMTGHSIAQGTIFTLFSSGSSLSTTSTTLTYDSSQWLVTVGSNTLTAQYLVPEPSSMMLTMAACIGGVLLRRRGMQS